jgi:hypothetical protein
MTSAEAAMTTIAPAFIHYFKSRNAATDPYSCFVYITAEMKVDSGLSSFTLSSPKKGPNLTFHNDPFKRTNVTAGDYVSRKDTYIGTFRFNLDNLEVQELHVYQWDIDIRDSTGAKIPVLTIMNINRLFKKTLKRNMLLFAAAGVAVSSRTAGEVTPPDPVAAAPAPAPAPAPAISHVTSTYIPKLKTKKTYLAAPVVAQPKTDLCIFVAKQLLELAQLKKEMCPITAEEYYRGETAVMPCGHLFMQMAIEESFKKEPNKCPSCRQSGRPTYV